MKYLVKVMVPIWYLVLKSGGSERIRTSGLQIRNLPLYPAELRPQWVIISISYLLLCLRETDEARKHFLPCYRRYG
jgi:hypothetical protein